MRTTNHEWHAVGSLSQIGRFPVKALRGQSPRTAHVGIFGIEGDRRWALAISEQLGDPISARRFPQLATWTAELRDDTDHPCLRITSADGATEAVELHATGSSPVLAGISRALGRQVRLVAAPHGAFDVAPISILTAQAVRTIGEKAGVPLAAARFRPNLVIDATGDDPFPEDLWEGDLRIGSRPDGPTMHIERRSPRCKVVNFSSTGRVEPVLRVIAGVNDGNLGVYATVLRPGAITVGDNVSCHQPTATPATKESTP